MMGLTHELKPKVKIQRKKPKAKLLDHENEKKVVFLNVPFCVLPQPTIYSFVSIFLAVAHRWNTVQIFRRIFLTYSCKGRCGRISENKHRPHVVLIVKSIDFILFRKMYLLCFHWFRYKICKTWTILDLFLGYWWWAFLHAF